MPTYRTLMISSAIAAAALMLTGCTADPVEHGEVIEKRGYAGSWIRQYEDVYRENCTTVRTSAFTASLTGRTSGGSGGKTSTSGKTGSGRGKGKSGADKDTGPSTTSGGTQPGGTPLSTGGSDGNTTSGSTGSSTGGTQPTKRCERQYVGKKESGKHWKPGKWELQLRDGDRTGWITVSQSTYDDTNLHDRI
ncbi:hypothetical protein [Streptomyces sp. NPDC059949]|uniref:hypothetical protein n=1 Tax=Streptomyces sp. NPDC059949 TaxID=3347013 RepID=UPI0036530AA5